MSTPGPASRSRAEDQVKGYEVGKDDYVVLEPEEIAAAVPESDKRLTVSAFVDRDEIDDVYFDRPYFLAPSDRSGDEAFALIREGLRASNAAAIAQAVLFRRVRTLLIRPLRRRPRRDDAQFRLRGPLGPGGVRRRAGPRDQGRDAGARRAHHQDESRATSIRQASRTATRRRWPNWSRPRSRAARSRRRSGRSAPPRPTSWRRCARAPD